MKLSIIQAILGVFIILAACCVTSWMALGAEINLYMPAMVGYYVYPHNELLFYIGKYGSNLLPAIGILALICGTIQAAKGGIHIRDLAIGNIVAGILIATLACIIVLWGYPNVYLGEISLNTHIYNTIFHHPWKLMAVFISLSILLFPLGLAVVGVGIAQLVKSKRTAAI